MSTSASAFSPVSPSTAEQVCGRTVAARGRAIFERGDVITAFVAMATGPGLAVRAS